MLSDASGKGQSVCVCGGGCVAGSSLSPGTTSVGALCHWGEGSEGKMNCVIDCLALCCLRSAASPCLRSCCSRPSRTASPTAKWAMPWAPPRARPGHWGWDRTSGPGSNRWGPLGTGAGSGTGTWLIPWLCVLLPLRGGPGRESGLHLHSDRDHRGSGAK